MKPSAAGFVRQHVAPLPRLPSRGLIEAGARAGRLASRPDFPGYQAGASLKHVHVPIVAALDSPNFPGYQAGASLKQVGLGH